jgi:hypothetical protein
MFDQQLGIWVLLPTMLMCYAILTTFYGLLRAYVVLCWIPVVLFLIARMFNSMEYRPDYGTMDLGAMIPAIVWTSFFQGILGVIVTIYAAVRKDVWLVALLATALVFLPFILR